MYIDSLDYDKNLFIFGENVETPFGILRFLTYKEYLLNLLSIGLISQNSLHIYYNFKGQLEESKADKEVLEQLKNLKETDLYEIVLGTEQLLNAYLKLFQLVFDNNNNIELEAIFEKSENFHFIRKLIMDMNVITEENVSPNEEIQKALERSKRVKQQSSEEQSFVDVVTSVVASTNHSFEEVGNMTVFQVYATYARIGAIYNYQTSTLFATVAEKVDIESWNKHIDLFKDEKDYITRDQFNKKFGSIFG